MRLIVEGMHCNSCKMLIEEELEDLGAKDVKVMFDPKTMKGEVSFEGLDRGTVVEAIENLGDYKVR